MQTSRDQPYQDQVLHGGFWATPTSWQFCQPSEKAAKLNINTKAMRVVVHPLPWGIELSLINLELFAV